MKLWDGCCKRKMTFFPLILFFFPPTKRIGLCIQKVQKNVAFTILLLIYIQKTTWLLGACKAQKSDIHKFCTRILLFSRSAEHPALPCRSAGLRGAQRLFWSGIQLGSSVKAWFEILQSICVQRCRNLCPCAEEEKENVGNCTSLC